mgnify:CR=1 FL=1
MAKSKYLDFKANFKKGFSKPELMDDLQALAAAPMYIGIPSILGLSGWTAWLVGVGVPFIIGKATGLNQLSRSALALGLTHIIYVKGEEMIKSISKNGNIWELGMSDYVVYQHGAITSGVSGLAETPNTSYGLQPGSEVRNIGGEELVYFPSISNDDNGVNDYIAEGGMYDYVNDSDDLGMHDDAFGMHEYLGTEGLVAPVLAGKAY